MQARTAAAFAAESHFGQMHRWPHQRVPFDLGFHQRSHHDYPVNCLAYNKFLSPVPCGFALFSANLGAPAAKMLCDRTIPAAKFVMIRLVFGSTATTAATAA